MVGWLGLWKMLNRALPLFWDLSWRSPFFLSQPPLYRSWSSQRVGKPVPGLVSTLFHHMYSVPLRSVQMFLKAIEQVWQPMHLSRWNTIETCERTFMVSSQFPFVSSQLLRRNRAITTSAPAVSAPARGYRGYIRSDPNN